MDEADEIKQLILCKAWVGNSAWAGIPGLVHGTLTRQESVTEGKLPMSQSVGRARTFFDALIQSRRVNNPGMTIIGADQVHGDTVAVVRAPKDLQNARQLTDCQSATYDIFEFPEADALITSMANALLVIQTADCLPILYRDPDSDWIGACHCGWRGLFAGLAQKTARAMISLGSKPESLEAWIGPGIRAGYYEVGGELVAKFQRQFPGTRVSPEGTHLDLAEIAKDELLAAGLRPEKIIDSGECTFAKGNLYHSYRRDGPGAGRLLTVIGKMG